MDARRPPGARRYDDLPREAQRYVARLEEITGVPAAIISTGSAREDTIIREDSVAAAWFGRADANALTPSDSLFLDLGAEVVERRGVRVGEVHAGAVARRIVRLGQLELRPRDRAAEAHHEVVVRNAHADLLVRPQDRRRQHLHADDDRSTTLAGLPSTWISTPGRTR